MHRSSQIYIISFKLPKMKNYEPKNVIIWNLNCKPKSMEIWQMIWNCFSWIKLINDNSCFKSFKDQIIENAVTVLERWHWNHNIWSVISPVYIMGTTPNHLHLSHGNFSLVIVKSKNQECMIYIKLFSHKLCGNTITFSYMKDIHYISLYMQYSVKQELITRKKSLEKEEYQPHLLTVLLTVRFCGTSSTSWIKMSISTFCTIPDFIWWLISDGDNEQDNDLSDLVCALMWKQHGLENN